MKKKIITVCGTRPELIRLSALIRLLDAQIDFHHVLVHTGQNDHQQLKDVFFKDLKIRIPNYSLASRKATREETIKVMHASVRNILVQEKPDLFVVLGDTDSGLTAIVAKELKIPVLHLEAGNRCFDLRSPEEANRKMIDAIATVNMPYSHYGKQHLLEEKLTQPIVISGSPLPEVLTQLTTDIAHSGILKTLALVPNQYFVWSTHRAEHIEDAIVFEKLMLTLTTVAKTFPSMPIVMTIHPRLKQKLVNLTSKLTTNIIQHEPFGLLDYLALQVNAKAVLSDSGSIHEEADILGFHAIHLRRQHERQEAQVIPVCFLSEFNEKEIVDHLKKLPIEKPAKGRVESYRSKDFSKIVMTVIRQILFEKDLPIS